MYKDIINNKCIIRSYEAGIYFGTVVSVDGDTVRVENARNIWKWEGASCLSQIANDGIRGGKVSQVVRSMVLFRCCQIIPCTERAIKNLSEFSVWKY